MPTQEMYGKNRADQRRRPHLNILLSHNPDTKHLVNEYDWALMLSGHTHGGQFRIPFSNYAPLAPVSDLIPYGGLRKIFTGGPHFITRGIGSLYGVRVNCRPEALAYLGTFPELDPIYFNDYPPG